MEKYKAHPRYRKIVLNNGDGNYHNQAKRTLRIVLFISDKKLRCHTVKHLMNPEEFKKTWKNITHINEDVIHRSIDNLNDIGCERNVDWVKSPPCKKCSGPKFNKCTDYISELENHYLKASLQIIIKGGAIPRFADFFSNWIRTKMFVLMSDRSVNIKAVYLKDDTYNLMTCYSHPTKDTIEMRDSIREKVLMEAREDSISWCKKNKWGFEALMNRPYIRGGNKNWSQFLDESDN